MQATNTHELRNALGRFVTGVTIITTVASGAEPVGITANSFTSVSLVPPLVLFNLRNQAFSCPAFQNHGYFAVNLLSDEQAHMANQFAKASIDKWSGVRYRIGRTECPILQDCLATFECKTRSIYAEGDHRIFVGEVLHMAVACDGRPLLFYGGEYASVGSKDI